MTARWWFSLFRDRTPNGLTQYGVNLVGVTFAATYSPDGGWQRRGKRLRSFSLIRDDEGDTRSRCMPIGPVMIGFAWPKMAKNQLVSSAKGDLDMTVMNEGQWNEYQQRVRDLQQRVGVTCKSCGDYLSVAFLGSAAFGSLSRFNARCPSCGRETVLSLAPNQEFPALPDDRNET